MRCISQYKRTYQKNKNRFCCVKRYNIGEFYPASMHPLVDEKMTKQIAVSLGIVSVLTVLISLTLPMFQPEAVAQQQSNSQNESRSQGIEYGRLVFGDDDNYNWIAGDGPIRPATSILNLINRLDGRTRRASFATLLDTLGSQGWELIFETEDPEGFGQVLIFKRGG